MSLARLRGAGALPWLLFAAWLVIASGQEPVLLRGYGVHLVEDAAWAGGFVLLLVLLLAEPRLPWRAGWLANLALLILIAAFQATLPLMLEIVRGRAFSCEHVVGMAGFALCWAPLTLTLAVRPAARLVARSWLVVPAFLLGCAHSVALRSSEPFHGALSAAVALLAVVPLLSTRRKSL